MCFDELNVTMFKGEIIGYVDKFNFQSTFLISMATTNIIKFSLNFSHLLGLLFPNLQMFAIFFLPKSRDWTYSFVSNKKTTLIYKTSLLDEMQAYHSGQLGCSVQDRGRSQWHPC